MVNFSNESKDIIQGYVISLMKLKVEILKIPIKTQTLRQSNNKCLIAACFDSIIIACFDSMMSAVGGRISCGNFWRHRKAILNMPSYLNIVSRNCLGRNSIIHDQCLRKLSNKKLKIEIATKLHECFTISLFKIGQPKNKEISTSISLML